MYPSDTTRALAVRVEGVVSAIHDDESYRLNECWLTRESRNETGRWTSVRRLGDERRDGYKRWVMEMNE